MGSSEKRGSIAFFATYRPPVALDIYSCPMEPPPTSKQDELPYIMTTESSTDDRPSAYNYNGQAIPPAALKKLLKRPVFSEYKETDVDSGRLLGLIFVSERDDCQLETLHIALRFNNDPKAKVFSLAQVFGTTQFKDVRMEDSGCFAGDYLIYVTTRDPAPKRRQPWTAVYRTHLITGQTQRLTPPGVADLSPSVSPSGKMIAVASFEYKEGGWDGEIENLKTDILVMNVDEPFNRKLVVKEGGWPTWGSDNVIFFHRKVGKLWGVFRADNISKSFASSNTADIVKIDRVVPDDDPKAETIDARTPAAISETKVAVATIRMGANINAIKEYKQRVIEQYRHIEIFEYATSGTKLKPAIKLTQNTRPRSDHYNPFVIHHGFGGKKRIGYHHCKSETMKEGDDIPRQFQRLASPYPNVGAFRVSGVFPTFSKDGSKLAFVDNEFKNVWVADDKGLRIVFSSEVNKIFSPVWNQNPDKDTLYICVGPAFNAKERLDICAIKNVSKQRQQRTTLTKIANNAFPSTNPDGTKLVFRSTRDYHGHEKRHKNLYIMEDANLGDYGESDEPTRRLTVGEWTDTHCQWSPRGDWIVFSSTRNKPPGSPDDNGLDPGYFAVYLVKWNDLKVVVRVAASGYNIAGHVNHPVFSPDGKSIVVTADLAAVSVDPVSLPLFVHSVRPYGDIFIIDIDPNDIKKNQDVEKFDRITHSRYEYSTASWTEFSTTNPKAKWNMRLPPGKSYTPKCPYAHADGVESVHMTGHLCLGSTRGCC